MTAPQEAAETHSEDAEASGAESSQASREQVTCARIGLALIVLLPLSRLSGHGFTGGHGVDTLLLELYILLLLALVLCMCLSAPPNETDEGRPPRKIQRNIRIGYAVAWVLVPILTRDLDWSAFATLPIGIIGFLCVQNMYRCWCMDTYVLAIMLGPCVSVSLGYSLELSSRQSLVQNISVGEWQPYYPARGNAFMFLDGYVVSEWRERLAEWSHSTGRSSKALRSEYGVMPVLRSSSCLTGNHTARHIATGSSSSSSSGASVSDSRYYSSCEVEMIVMYLARKPRVRPEHVRSDDAVLGSTDSGYQGGDQGGGTDEGSSLRVYSDPLYRAPRGIPHEAVEECHYMMTRHQLGPQDICDTNYFLIDSREQTRRHTIHAMAGLSLLAFLAGVGFGVSRGDTRVAERSPGLARRVASQYEGDSEDYWRGQSRALKDNLHDDGGGTPREGAQLML